MRPVGKTSLSVSLHPWKLPEMEIQPVSLRLRAVIISVHAQQGSGLLVPFQFSSQHDFLNNPSLTSVSRRVDSVRDSLKGTASDFSSDEAFQESRRPVGVATLLSGSAAV